MSRRVKHALRAAAPPSIAILIVGAPIVLARWSMSADDPLVVVTIMSGLVVVVFLTYFILAMIGFKASPHGAVVAPRIYAWSVLCAIVILVFGVLFYVLQFRS